MSPWEVGFGVSSFRAAGFRAAGFRAAGFRAADAAVDVVWITASISEAGFI